MEKKMTINEFNFTDKVDYTLTGYKPTVSPEKPEEFAAFLKQVNEKVTHFYSWNIDQSVTNLSDDGLC